MVQLNTNASTFLANGPLLLSVMIVLVAPAVLFLLAGVQRRRRRHRLYEPI